MSFKTKWLYVWSAYAMISISIDYFLQASSSCICHIPYPYKDNNLNRRLPTNDLAEAVMPPFIVNTLKPWYNEQVRHTLFVHYHQIIPNIKCNMHSKSSKRELDFVHYIAKFTISRFVISRFECTAFAMLQLRNTCVTWPRTFYFRYAFPTNDGATVHSRCFGGSLPQTLEQNVKFCLVL